MHRNATHKDRAQLVEVLDHMDLDGRVVVRLGSCDAPRMDLLVDDHMESSVGLEEAGHKQRHTLAEDT